MRVRWIGLTLALVLAGGAVGYAVGMLRDQDPVTVAEAIPLPARGPSIPVTPTPPFAEDIDFPVLEPGLDYTERTLGSGPYFAWSYDAPTAWVMTTEDRDEVRWRPPDQPYGGYSMRVKLVNENRTTEQMVEARRLAMLAEYDDVEILDETDDSIFFSFRDPVEDIQRFNRFHWSTGPGSTEAKFEMSVVGRERDLPGLADLFDHVAASIAKVG